MSKHPQPPFADFIGMKITHLTPEGACPRCATKIPGRWGAKFEGQITERPFVPGRGARRASQLFVIR